MSQPSSTAITPLSLDPKRNGAFGDGASGGASGSTPSATPAAVVDPTSGQTINTANGQPVVDPAQQEATMAAQSEAQSAQLQVQSAEQQAQAATQQAQLEAQKKDLEIQQAQQAAETAKAQLDQTTQQLKTQEKQLAEVSKQQPVAPQLSPAVTNRVKKIVGSVKPMDNSALLSMKLASAGLRPRGYQGGHNAKTTSLLAGARQLHNAKTPRMATAEEMRPHQQYGGHDWSNYRPRDGADPRDLSGTWGVASGPGYMEQINAARDRVLAKGGDPSAFGVTPVAPAPSPTAQPGQPGTGGTRFTEIGAPSNRPPGIYQDGQLMVKDPSSGRYVPSPAPTAPQTASAPQVPNATPAPTSAQAPIASAPAPVAPPPAATPPQPPVAAQTPAPYNPSADPAMAPYSGSPAPAPYSAATDPAMAPYGGASSPAAPPVNKPFDRSGSLERILKGLNVPAVGATPGWPAAEYPPDVDVSKLTGRTPTAPTFSSRPFGVDPFKPGPQTLLPPDNPLGLPPAMLPGQSPEGGQWDPAMQQLLYQLLGQATSGGGYQPLGSLGGGYKLASAPPKPVAPQPAGPQIKSFDHGDYRFSDPEATKFLANPATPDRERNWAYDRAAQDYFKRWGHGTHNQAADYFAAQYPGQETGQHVAERVRQLSNDQIRQQYRGEGHQTPVDTLTRALEGDGSLWSKAKSFAAVTHPLMPVRMLGETALGGWRDWTGTADQEMQDQLIPQQSRYGSVANMTPEQRQQMLATGVDQVAARQRDIDAWNHRWMGDQKDIGAGLSNLYGAFFEAGAPTPASPDKPDPMMNPWANYWNNSDSAIGKGVLGATMLSPAPLIQAAFTSPTVLKHALGDGQMTAQLAARAGGDAMDAFNQFGQGNWREGSEETRNAATAAVLARLNGQLLTPGKELLSRLPFYGMFGTDAFQPNASRGQAIDSGVYEGGQPGTAGAASPGLWSDLTTGAGKYLNVFRQPDPEAKPNAAAPLLSAATALTGVGPSVLGGNKAEVAPVPEKIQAQIAPTAGESVGGMQAVGDAITNATGAEPGSSTWVQILTLLLPFLAPMFARLGIGGGQNDGSLAGSSTANSYYGPEMYGGAV